MTKIVRNSHVIGERGVIKFADYCNQHQPYIIFREVTKHDFGIDGEIEVVRTNEESKKVATGEILKVQIKSTASDNGYIKNEKDDSFEFNAKQDDIDYWSKYKLDVLLIIYDNRVDKLYCKKINQVDLVTSKKKTIPIIFDKQKNLLEFGKHDFVQKYSQDFKSRVDYDSSETLCTNILEFKHFPRVMYAYDAKYASKKTIFQNTTNEEAPLFVIYNSILYSFCELGTHYPTFANKILNSQSKKLITYAEIMADLVIKTHYVELLNQYIKNLFSDKRMRYSKEYDRFFFTKPKDANTKIVKYKTRKQKRENDKAVVNFYTYGKDSFYRHLALHVDFLFNEEKPFLIFTPKYYFTKDGKDTLSPDKITKYTNYLTARELNESVLNQIHFYLDYLSGGDEIISVWNFDKFQISISKYTTFKVNFSIPLDVKAKAQKNNAKDLAKEQQAQLF